MFFYFLKITHQFIILKCQKCILYLIILMQLYFAFLIYRYHCTIYFLCETVAKELCSSTATATQCKTCAWTHNNFAEFLWGVLWDHVLSVLLFWFIPVNNLTILVCVTLNSKLYMMGWVQIKIWTDFGALER